MTELIPLKVLFGNPERISPSISSDGTKLAWIAPHEGVLNVWVAPISDEGVAWQADVSDERQVVAMVDGVAERFGRLDVLINNAGTTVYIPIPDLDSVTDEAWRDIIATNLMGPWYCARAAAAHLKKARGCIVNVASLAGHKAVSSSLPYGVSKAGLIQMTRALAYALAPEVRVNSISPGQVVSRWARVRKGEEFAQKLEQGWAEMVPLKRAIEPEDCAEAIMGLLRSDSITGQDLLVDSGRSL